MCEDHIYEIFFQNLLNSKLYKKVCSYIFMDPGFVWWCVCVFVFCVRHVCKWSLRGLS